MATAFQQNAFQDDAFQIDGITPPVPGGGGGGSVQAGYGERKLRRKLERLLEKAIRAELNPRKIAEVPETVIKLWTKPQRQTVFPNVWQELLLASVIDQGIEQAALLISQAVAQQRALYEAQVQQALVMAEDEAAAEFLLDLMVRDLI